MLSRKLDAKILISNDFVSNSEEKFPIGRLVTGRVLSLELLSKRIEVSLHKTSGSKEPKGDGDFSSLHVGAIVSGRVKRVELYGLFIIIDRSKSLDCAMCPSFPRIMSTTLKQSTKFMSALKLKFLRLMKKDEEYL
ncbi:hypothetical protein Hdeb2414_s0006g00216971 [Helianthus debilis subsp. tardiflorus]